MIRIRLNCGRDVKVNGFQFGYTYGGLLEGSPNERMNKSIFERTTYPSDWGGRKVIKIQPDNNDFKTKLKPTYYIVWLNSFEPINPNFDGSELVVIWFDDLPNGKMVEDIIQKGVENISWNDNAQDFDY
ncbi:hypothetical protein LVD15_26270 [Fulvivirga maritima]|uniref:hypothetical protein n=1 Tax=Fulvivirga maritima TaxID=2904247 RepID=UPI001F1CAF72|nr:hypothetical protein [Fulvivirga maritima]UII26759.1 hypothetical protein LVD15_26270 [Fulvivirga maritima]